MERCDWVQTLIGIHFARLIGVSCDLPPAHVDRLETATNLLNGLVAGEGSEGRDKIVGVKHFPQAFRADSR